MTTVSSNPEKNVSACLSADGKPLISKESLPSSRPSVGSPYLEVSPYAADGGEKIGTNPLSVSKHDLKALGHPESYPKAIRAKCIDCCGDQISEVRKCTAMGCPLWPYRMGKSPFDARAKRVGGGS